MPEIINNINNEQMITAEQEVPAEMLAQFEAAGGIDKFIEEDQLRVLRDQRNIRLAETDWMGNSDVTISDDWIAYRQALRDITSTYKNIEEVIWPSKP
jgi:hypothetical protein